MVFLNGIDAAEARITLPRIGAWHARLTLTASSGIAKGDRVTLMVGSLALRGVAQRCELFEDSLLVRVVAGAGGMGKVATAKGYRGARLQLVLSDLLGAAGEALASSADAGILGTSLPAWSVFARTVGVEFSTLLSVAPAGTAWRFAEDGGLWLGPETWAAASIAPWELLERSPANDRLTLSSEAPTLLPGTTLDGDRIGDVEHIITADEVKTIARLA